MSDGNDLDAVAENKQPQTIKLRSKNKEKFVECPRSAAAQSKMLKHTMETDPNCQEIDLQHIEIEILEKIVAYLKMHENNPPKPIPKPLTSNNLRDFVSEEDAKFCETDQDTMFKLLLAANYLDIQSLLMLQCAKVASMMRGQTPENIRKIFNIRSDYTPEEEEQVRKEYKDLLE